jgi:Protein of unknown function (DUF2530)
VNRRSAGGKDVAPRVSPPPLEANDRLVTAVFTGGWAIALVVVLALYGDIRQDERWWLWTTVAGLVMGLFALWYVPHLQRARARLAQQRATPRQAGEQGQDT